MKSCFSRQTIRRWAGNVLAVCLGFLLVAVLLATAEGMFRLKARLFSSPPGISVISTQKGAVSRTGMLGGGLLPNGVVQCQSRRKDRVLYDVSSMTDEKGRRHTPCDCQNPEARIAAFFGCSETFGLGVEDAETMPARFCAHAPGWESLNYGVFGYGPQQVWPQICKQGVLQPFHSRGGIIVYTFIDDHVNRLIGTPNIVSEWSYPLPWLDLQDGRIAYRGTFYDRAPLQYLLLHYLDRTHLARFAENRLPRRQAPARPADKAVDLWPNLFRSAQTAHRRNVPVWRSAVSYSQSSRRRNAAGPWRNALTGGRCAFWTTANCLKRPGAPWMNSFSTTTRSFDGGIPGPSATKSWPDNLAGT